MKNFFIGRVVGLVVFILLCCVGQAQVYTSTINVASQTYGSLTVTGQAVGTPGTSYGFAVPSTFFKGNANWSISTIATTLTLSSTGSTNYSVSGGWASGALQWTLGTSATAILNSTDETITFGGTFLYSGSGQGTFSFTGSWHHATGTVTGMVTGISSRTQTYAATNTTGQLCFYGLFQCATTSVSSYTGVEKYPVELSPGASWTWTVQIPASDPYFYYPEPENSTAELSSGTYRLSQDGSSAWGAIPLTTTGTAAGYATGTVQTAPVTPGTSGSVVDADGGLSGGTTTGYSGSSPVTATSPTVATTVTAGTTTLIGGGTNGGGGGGASDAGLVNNAAAINNGLNVAAGEIMGQDASDTNAITKQLGLIAAGASGSGGAGTDNAGIESAINGIAAHSDSYSASSSQAAWVASTYSSYSANLASGVSGVQASAAAAGAGIGTSQYGTDMSGVTGGSNPAGGYGDGWMAAPHNATVTDGGFLQMLFGTNFDSNFLTGTFLGGVFSNAKAVAFVAWVRAVILWSAILWFFYYCSNEVNTLIRSIASVSAGTPLAGTALITAGAQAAGFSLGTVAGLGIQALWQTLFAGAILAAPAILCASIDTAVNLSSLVFSFTSAKSTVSGGSSGLADIFDVINYAIPVATLFTIAVNKVIVKNVATVQMVAVTLAFKVFPS